MSDTGSGSDESGGTFTWVGAVILIAIGVVFLLQNLGYPVPGNWWALFLLIPALAAFASGWRTYTQAGNRLTAASGGSFVSGLVLIGFALVFLFDIDVDWGLLWPAVLILIGAGALARGFFK